PGSVNPGCHFPTTVQLGVEAKSGMGSSSYDSSGGCSSLWCLLRGLRDTLLLHRLQEHIQPLPWLQTPLEEVQQTTCTCCEGQTRRDCQTEEKEAEASRTRGEVA